jgi:hypothetical protein
MNHAGLQQKQRYRKKRRQLSDRAKEEQSAHLREITSGKFPVATREKWECKKQMGTRFALSGLTREPL